MANNNPVFNPVAPYGYLLPNVYLFMADIANPDLLVGPRFVSTSSAFMRRSASHLADLDGLLAPQNGKLYRLEPPSMFSFYIADMPRPTDPVKRVWYADDLTVWASGIIIPDLEASLNNYLEEITAYLKDNSLLNSAQSLQSRCSLQIHTKPSPILVYSWRIHACRWLSSNRYWSSRPPIRPLLIIQQAQPLCIRERVSSRNNILKALASTSWGQQMQTLLMTYKAIGRSIINHTAPVWESKPTRHQLQKNPIYTKRDSEDRHWLSQDVQY